MPEDVIAHYNLNEIATPEGYIYCKIRKGMYGLPQAGIIAQQLLEERLQMDGYCQSKTTPGLWQQDTRPISFSLIVDGFGVKYVGEENAQHLLDTIQNTTNAHATGKANDTADLPLSGTTRARKSTSSYRGTSKKPSPAPNTPPPAKRQDQPYPRVKAIYGAKKQYSQEDDDSPALNKAGKNSFKRSAECSFSLQGRPMEDYSLPSALLHPNRQTQQRKQCSFASNF